MTIVNIQTGIWYQDKTVQIDFPDAWDVKTHWPNTPKKLQENEIKAAIMHVSEADSLQEQLNGKKDISIVVDDLSRPTPVSRVLPLVLQIARALKIDLSNINIVVATGTHGPQDSAALRKKIGEEAFNACRIEVHDDLKMVKYIGKTSYETPVYVNKTVLGSELILGIGGVYPQHSTGFGGGGKLALGICGRQTIMELHYKHKSMNGRYDTNNDFRRDVCEIAQKIRLNYSITIHIDAFSNIVHVIYGRHSEYYDLAAKFSKEKYTVPTPGSSDLIVANAYPLDTSFTFMRKGYKPLYLGQPTAVKLMIVAANEGVGVHGLFQYIQPSVVVRYRNLILRAWSMNKRELFIKVLKKLTSTISRRRAATVQKEQTTILPPNTNHLYVWRTDSQGENIPDIDNVTVRNDWGELLDLIIKKHFAGRRDVKVAVYPCAPIQCIDETQLSKE